MKEVPEVQENVSDKSRLVLVLHLIVGRLPVRIVYTYHKN